MYVDLLVVWQPTPLSNMSWPWKLLENCSNNGVEQVRELRDTAPYAPATCRYKVYIIDEVHMLTNEAFNALLKTLEEPPPQVIMILATTEYQKLPETIISRCQRFDFRNVSNSEVVKRLRSISENEEITYEAYVSEQNLLADDSGDPIQHPLINEIFSGKKQKCSPPASNPGPSACKADALPTEPIPLILYLCPQQGSNLRPRD